MYRYVPTPKKLYPNYLVGFFFGPGDLYAAHAWPLGLKSDDESMPDEFRRPAPFLWELSSRRKTIYCHSLEQPGVRCLE